MNSLHKATANVVANQLGVNNKRKFKKKEPWSKRRLEGQMKEVRKDIID